MTAPGAALLPAMGVVAAAVLSVAATILGHRGATGGRAPGVRAVKTAVPALLAVSLAGAYVLRGSGMGWFEWMMLAGLGATVVADWFLAPLDNSATFVPGLAAFLLGYLLYGSALLVRTVIATGPDPTMLPVALAAVVGFVYAATATVSVRQYRRLTRLPRQLRGAVILYVAVAANLLAAGICTAIFLPHPVAGYLIGLGALSIYLSDSLIATNLFRRPLSAPELWIMPTYYLGQIAIVSALLLL